MKLFIKAGPSELIPGLRREQSCSLSFCLLPSALPLPHPLTAHDPGPCAVDPQQPLKHHSALRSQDPYSSF